MDFFTDGRCGMQFCCPVGSNIKEVPDYSLWEWGKVHMSGSGTFVDVGSSWGAAAMIIGKHCQHVMAFESQLERVDCLIVAASLNDLYNIEVKHATLGDQDGTASWYRDSQGCGSLSHRELPDLVAVDKITTQTLDSFELANVQFLMVRARGAELKVLEGAIATLASNDFPPVLVKTYSSNREAITKYLQDLGYQTSQVRGYEQWLLAAGNGARPAPTPEPVADTVAVAAWRRLLAAATEHRLQSRHQESYDCAKEGLANDPPPEQRYAFYQEIGIVAWYLKRPEEGLAACETVILDPHTPEAVRELMINNQRFYLSSLTPLKSIPLNILSDPTTGLAVHQLVVRDIDYDGSDLTDKDELCNYLLWLNADWQIVKSQRLVHSHYQLDGLRLLSGQRFLGRWWSAADPEADQGGMGEYQADGTVKRLQPLTVVGAGKQRWSAWIQGKETYILTGLDPPIVCRVQGERMVVQWRREGSLALQGWNPATEIVSHQGGWLLIAARGSHYRWVWFKEGFTAIKVSLPFIFEQRQITGLAGDSREVAILTASGVDQLEMELQIVDRIAIDRALRA